MLQRPKRTLPRSLRRRVSPELRLYARKRHMRHRARRTERTRRNLMRIGRAAGQFGVAIRKWILPIVLVLLTGAFLFVIASPILEVRSIRVERSEARTDIERVQNALAPLFGRRMLFLSTGEVTNLLQNDFPDLQSVSVSKRYPSEIFVKLKLEPIVAKLVIEEPPQPTNASGAVLVTGSGNIVRARGQDYLTEHGIYVQLAASFSGLTTLTLTDWTLRPIPNTRLLPPDFLAALKEAEKGLASDLKQTVTRRTVLLRAREFQLTMNSGITYWFDTRSTVEVQRARLKIFRQSVGLGEVKRYVDLRLAGRVIYR